MELVLHIGAHFTEDERLVKCLLRNQGNFAKRGIAVPGPGKYRTLLRDTLNAMTKQPAASGARDILLDAILDDTPADRLILSDPNFMRPSANAMQDGLLYPAASARMSRMAQLFAADEIEIFLAIRNPAAMLPRIHSRAKDLSDEEFWGGRRPQDIRWSETIAQIRRAVPEAPITVWCSEDSPLLWSYVLHEMAGVPHTEKIVGGFDLLSSIMSTEGMKRFRAYLQKYPVMTELQKRKVIAAFLDKFGLDDEIEEELSMPGWTDALIDEMTDIYDADLQAIERIPGVNLLVP